MAANLRAGAWRASFRPVCLRLVFTNTLDLQQLQMRARRGERPEMRTELGVRDQHVDASVSQDEIYLVRLQEVVDRDHNRAQVQNPEERRDEFRAILQPKPYPITGLTP